MLDPGTLALLWAGTSLVALGAAFLIAVLAGRDGQGCESCRLAPCAPRKTVLNGSPFPPEPQVPKLRSLPTRLR